MDSQCSCKVIDCIHLACGSKRLQQFTKFTNISECIATLSDYVSHTHTYTHINVYILGRVCNFERITSSVCNMSNTNKLTKL